MDLLCTGTRSPLLFHTVKNGIVLSYVVSLADPDHVRRRVTGFDGSCWLTLTVHSNALHHLGYEVSRSHAAAGSVKTDAPRSAIHDIFMAWVDDNPVKMDKIDDKAPAKKLLTRERGCVPVI